MTNALYIGLGVGLGALAMFVVVLFSVKRKKKDKNPTVLRAENMIVMINQRILSFNSRIEKLDKEITALLAAQEKKTTSFLKAEIAGMTLKDIPDRVEKNKIDVKTFIADIKDLKEYKEEIEAILKKEVDLGKLEELLEVVKEKFQYRYT